MASKREYQRNTMKQLKEACIEGRTDELRKYMPIVKQHSFPFKALEKSNKPLVFWTTLEGQLEVLKELVEKHGCDPHYETERGDNLLYVACARGHSSVARYLTLVHKINPNQRNRFNATPLIVASNNGHLEAMVMLIDEFKCDPRAVTDKGESLLHRACGNGHLLVAKCLISKYGLNPDIRSSFNETPLHFACGNDHLPVARYLIEEQRCDVNAISNSHSTPLFGACRNGHKEVVHYLIKDQKCDVTLTDKSGNTPFHLACRYQRKEVVNMLLDSGKVDPNSPNLHGDIPIKLARNQEMIKCLVERGVKPIGRIQDILAEQSHGEPMVHTFLIGSSLEEKGCLVQTLQALASESTTITYYNPCNCGANIKLKLQNHHLLLHDYVGQPGFLRHDALHTNSNSLSAAPLILLIMELKDCLEELKRNADHWVSLLEEQYPPSINHPLIIIIGSHIDELQSKYPKKYKDIVSALRKYVQSRLQMSRFCYDGFITINYRDTKCQGQLHKHLKKSCDALQRFQFEACCHILNVFLIKEFKGKVSCTIADIIQRASAANDVCSLGSNVISYICELAEVLNKQNKFIFLQNNINPEKSLIIFDADTLINNMSHQLLTSQKLSSIELSQMTNISEIPWSQIQHQLPALDLDPSTVASFLESLGYLPTNHGTLQLTHSEDSTSLSSDIGYLATKWPSIDSGISSASCLTTSSDASIEQETNLFRQHSRSSTWSNIDTSCGPNKDTSESAVSESKHNIEEIKATTVADVYHEAESFATIQNKLSHNCDNRCIMSENCHTQDTDTNQLGQNGCYFYHSGQHVVKQYLDCPETIASVPFQDHVMTIEFDTSGREYKNNEHDITVSIPEGAIAHGEIVHMEVAVALYGPFQFSDGKRPISPILWVCPQENIVLSKPISIVLPHTLVDLTQADVTKFGIQVAKADHREYTTNSEGKRKYSFKPYSGEVELKSAQDRGYIEIKSDHFCFMCLEMNKLKSTTPDVARLMAMKMGYYLHCVESLQSPYLVSPPREVIHFCVSFFLETCRKAVEEQFPLNNSNGELIHRMHRPQRFTMKQSHKHLQLKHSTNFEETDIVTVALSNNGKICVSSVDFWESELEEDLLKFLHKEKQYPPRLEMTVQLANPTQGVILSAMFEGCADSSNSPNFQFILPVGSSNHIQNHISAAAALATFNGWKCYSTTSHGLPHKNNKPTMKELQCLTSGSIKIMVIKSIACKWRNLAMEMGYEYSDIESVEIQAQRDPQIAACTILGRWLIGAEGLCGPVTWSTLIECLSNIECQSLADGLNNALPD